jgi:hypothetical protein
MTNLSSAISLKEEKPKFFQVFQKKKHFRGGFSSGHFTELGGWWP